MNSPRYFIAAAPQALRENQDLKILLGKMKRTLTDRGRDVRWVPPELWHVTLSFLGGLNAEELQAVKDALTSGFQNSGVTLGIRGVGAFPSATEARVLWLGVENTQELKTLKINVDEKLAAAGVPHRDEQDFVPHMTLARLRNSQSVTDLVSLGGRKAFGAYPVHEIVLFESVLQGAMPKYTPLLVVGA